MLFWFVLINYSLLISAYPKTDQEMIENAYVIFERVRSVADKKANRYPELDIISQKGIRAYAQEDGFIRITQDTIRFCYANVDKNIGNTRLAFIFGHEMAHLANDDFWGYSSQTNQYDFGTRSNEKQANNERIKKEFKADAYGILYAFLADYDPKKIIQQNNDSFFHKWEHYSAASQIKRHPNPDDRQKQLQATIDNIMKSLDLFHIGVRLYQIGRYKEALDFFNAFKIKFPSREVYNNIGLIHYQIAIKNLSGYSEDQVLRFKLATSLDTESIAGKYRGCQSGRSAFKSHISQSIQFLKAACQKDSTYIPSRINLSSAYIMNSKYSAAIDILNEAYTLNSKNTNESSEPDILNNLAIAKYLRGNLPEEANMYEYALKQLKTIVNDDTTCDYAYFNIGRLLKENNHHNEYQLYWKQFLSLECCSMYARFVQKEFGLAHKIQNVSDIPLMDDISIPVHPGDLMPKVRKHLNSFSSRFLDKAFVREYFWSDTMNVLALDYVVIYVEKRCNQRIQSFYQNHKPLRTFTNNSGKMTYVYDRFAVDVRDNSIIQTIIF